MKSVSYTKKGPGRITKTGKVKVEKKIERNWIPKDNNICDDCFIERFPDFSYEGSTALTIWRMAWQLSEGYKRSGKTANSNYFLTGWALFIGSLSCFFNSF
jgi:hypothetical protein